MNDPQLSVIIPVYNEQATLAALFARLYPALDALGVVPAHVLVDGPLLPPGLPCPATPIVDGDRHSLSIAAASILAKVARDRLMADLARLHPGYGWERNAGYGTRAHLDALTRLGPTPFHRRSFAPVARVLTPSSGSVGVDAT